MSKVRECGCEGCWCAECGLGLNGSCNAPGAKLDPDCAYCRQRPHGPVTRKDPA
jgi:hypothetical protein